MKKQILIELGYKIASTIFGPLTGTIQWASLRNELDKIDDPHSVGDYFALMLLIAVFGGIAGFGIFFIVANFFPEFFSPVLMFLPLGLPLGIVALFMVQPWFNLSMKKRTINANLPLAILTMSTVVQSGAMPQYMFKSIAGNPDYPRLGKECAKIERYMYTLGLSLSEAIESVIHSTPSLTFRRFLEELLSTLKSGGDLREFMRTRADKAYFDYILSVQQSNKRIETFGDIYTAVLIAAPLFLFSSVMLMGVFGSDQGLFGFSIDFLLSIGIFIVIPIVNIGFVVVMELMTPEGG